MWEVSRGRVIALAGVFQAACIVQRLARSGAADSDAMSATVRSILVADPASPEAVFGGLGGIRDGLLVVRNKFTARPGPLDVELARYALALVQLQTRLRQQPAMVHQLTRRIDAAIREYGEAGELPVGLYDDLSRLYSDTVSRLTPRIMVQGEQGYLGDPVIAGKVRAVLLAGLRATFLWYQYGGRRWQLLLLRKQYAQAADAVLAEAD